MVRRKRAARLLSRAELMELLIHAPSAERLPGDWESLFTGAGLEFHGLREMAPADPYRHVDWRATARTGQPWVREFHADGTVDLMLLMDASPSMAFENKARLQANIAAALLMSASRGYNPCGLIRYDNRVRTVVPPARGGEHRFRLAEALLEPPAESGGGTDFAGALRRLIQRIPTGLVVILSDFLHDISLPFSFGSRDLPHDVRAIQLLAGAEIHLPEGGNGFLPVSDSETGRKGFLDSRRRREYARRMADHHRSVRRNLAKAGIPLLQVSTDTDFVAPLAGFLRRGRGR